MKSKSQLNSQADIPKFLQGLAAAYPGGVDGAAFVLEFGITFQSRARQVNIPLNLAKNCFNNAQQITKARPDLIYIEGYARANAKAVPTEHAWVSDVFGRIYDPTWGRGYEYFGVPFSTEFADAFFTKYQCRSLIELPFVINLQGAPPPQFLHPDATGLFWPVIKNVHF